MSSSEFLLVGLTGSIGSGKSSVSDILRHLGAFTIDADKVSRDVMARDKKGYRRVVSEFGKTILAEDGEINRRKLAKIIFSDTEKAERLEKLLHPIIIDEENRIIECIRKSAKHGIIVVEASLMLETGSYERFSKIVVVTCEKEKRFSRLSKSRGMKRDMFERIDERQMNDADKLKYADYHIENDGTEDELFEKAVWLNLKLREDFKDIYGG